jgi:hypothetical protein
MLNLLFLDGAWERVVHDRDTVLLILLALDFDDCVYRRLSVPKADRALLLRLLR